MKFLNIKKINSKTNVIDKAIKEEKEAITFEIDQKFNEFLDEINDVITDSSININTRSEIVTAIAELYKGLCDITGSTKPCIFEHKIAIEEEPGEEWEEMVNEEDNNFISFNELVVDNSGRIYINKDILKDSNLLSKYLRIVNINGEICIVPDDDNNIFEPIKYVETVSRNFIRLSVRKLLNAKAGDYITIKTYKDRMVISKY